MAEKPQKNPQNNTLLLKFLKKLINENLIEYEEAIKFNSLWNFGKTESFLKEFQFNTSLQILKENPKLFPAKFETNILPKNCNKSASKFLPEEMALTNNQNSLKINIINKDSPPSFEISENNLSRLSFSDYSFQKNSEKFIDGADFLLTDIKKSDQENIVFDIFQHD